MMAMGEGWLMDELLTFENRAVFRDWLGVNGETNGGVWLIFGKKGGPKTLSAHEALEEALCHGWIDGVMQGMGEIQYKKYFARRIKKSNWSEKNKKIVSELIGKGIMTEAGLRAVDAAKANGSWDAAGKVSIEDDSVEAFKALVAPHELAYANLLQMSPSVQRTYTGFYFDAKSEKTRETRLMKIVDRLNQNLKPM